MDWLPQQPLLCDSIKVSMSIHETSTVSRSLMIYRTCPQSEQSRFTLYFSASGSNLLTVAKEVSSNWSV